WDEDECANGDNAGERDDEARVFDGKSQQVRDQKHRATYVWVDSAPWLRAAQARLLCNPLIFLFNLANVSKWRRMGFTQRRKEAQRRKGGSKTRTCPRDLTRLCAFALLCAFA